MTLCSDLLRSPYRLTVKSSVTLSLCILLSFSPLAAWACGGFFCNASQPINQSAERVVFALEGDRVDMHVQIQYQGPPSDFGWILPVAPGVETYLSSEALFVALDRLYAPRFILNSERGENCVPLRSGCENCDEVMFDGAVDDDVQVVSRENIGPYDRVILQAESVESLRGWLDENNYQIPETIDATLQPYIEAGAVFVAIKLLADRDSGDIVPLRLNFPGSAPVIPVIPTSVAAEPDMGMIVHLLGGHRAIPSNYRHVVINEAAVEWRGGGANYQDVVSQAVDEAGGRAFTTDYAGPIDPQITQVLAPYDGDLLAELAAATTFGEIATLIPDATNPDYQRIFNELFSEVDREWDMPADGFLLADRLMNELNPIYEQIGQLFFSAETLTRLYTTLSPEEMTVDPLFTFNPDLPEVSNLRTATLRISCYETGDIEREEIELSDGRVFEVSARDPVTRQDGETVRGAEISSAKRVEVLTEAGQPEVISEATGTDLTPIRSESREGCYQRRPHQRNPLLVLLGLSAISLLLRRGLRSVKQ